MNIDRIGKTNADIQKKPRLKKTVNKKAHEPVLKDKVDINPAAGKEVDSKSMGKAAASKAGNAGSVISLEKLDTPLDVASTPLGDPGFLSVVGKAIKADKNLAVTGTIKQGDVKYDVSFTVRDNKKFDNTQGIIADADQQNNKGYDYTLSGKLGDMPMNLHCYSSGLSLYVKGGVGDNPVNLKNKYSIFSGKIYTEGNVGAVKLDFWSKSKDNVSESHGEIGGVDFNETITEYSNGSTAIGNLGDINLSGESIKTSEGVFQTKNRIGDVETAYTVRFEDK